MNKRRLLFSLLAVILILSVSTDLLAQDRCGSLSRADCSILTRSQEAMAEVNSAAFHLDMAFEVRESFVFEPIVFRLAADGAYAVDMPDVAEATDLIQYFDDVVSGISLDMDVFIELPALEGEPLFGEIDNVLAFSLRMVDGIAYVNLDKLIEATDPGAIEPGWYGVNIAQLFRLLLAAEGINNPDLFLPPDEEIPQSVATLGEHSQLERLDDVEFDGQSMAVFREMLDLETLLDDPLVRDEVVAAIQEALRQQFIYSYSNAEFRQAASNYAKLLTDMTIETSRTIGQEDDYLHRWSFSWTFEPNLETLLEIADGPDPLEVSALLGLDMQFDFLLDLAQFNAAPGASTPPGATIIPLNELLPLLLQGSSL